MRRGISGYAVWAVTLSASLLLLSCGGGAGEPRQPDGATTSSTCSPQGSSLAVAARSSIFDVECLAAPAGQAFTITFDNRDGVEHNVTILASYSAQEPLFRGDLVSGPAYLTYRVSPLAAGTYLFQCDTHPETMRGTFVAS